jgi:hypothetical protein
MRYTFDSWLQKQAVDWAINESGIAYEKLDENGIILETAWIVNSEYIIMAKYSNNYSLCYEITADIINNIGDTLMILTTNGFNLEQERVEK